MLVWSAVAVGSVAVMMFGGKLDRWKEKQWSTAPAEVSR